MPSASIWRFEMRPPTVQVAKPAVTSFGLCSKSTSWLHGIDVVREVVARNDVSGVVRRLAVVVRMPGVAERVVARLRVHRPGELQLVAERRMGRSGDDRRVDAHHHGRKAPRILARRLRGLQLLEESHLPVRIDAGRDALQEPCPAVRIDMYEDVHLELPGRGGRRCVRERRNSLHLDVARPKPNRESRFVRRLLVVSDETASIWM